MSITQLNNSVSLFNSTGTCVVIPTYNNSSTLLDVVKGVLSFSDSVIVVNDGSTDNTLDIIQSSGLPVTLVSYDKNRGKGYALKHGFAKALELGFRNVVTIDSDGQHFPDNLQLFAETVFENQGVMIVGSRNLNVNNVPSENKFANKFSNFWFYLQTGIRLSDTQTGYRLYPISKMKFFKYMSNRYESELWLLVFAAWHNIKIVSIPVNVYYPPKDERISHFRPTTDFIRISILNTFLCFGALFYALPLKILRLLKNIF